MHRKFVKTKNVKNFIGLVENLQNKPKNIPLTIYRNEQKLNFKLLRIKNTLALLNQLIKYFQTQGIIDRTCVFQVKRLTEKNKFSINRIIFEGDL